MLEGALETPVANRAAFLDAACKGDPALRREVESLLAAASEEGDEFLEQLPALLTEIAAAAERSDESFLMSRLSAALGDDYVLERELGGGGMSRVFLALEKVAFTRQVVVKVLSPQRAHQASAERFAREVRVAGSLQQANIVPVLKAGQVGELAYYIMPYVRGESLRQRLTLGKVAPVPEAVGILKDIAKALAYAHGEGVVHRDIKPGNVLLSGGTAVVTDFGIAKAISVARTEANESPYADEITREGMAVGTPAYMAPEQAAADPDVGPRADVYSFGVVAYELLAARHPFPEARTDHEFVVAHLSETPRALTGQRPELPSWLSTLVMRCLEKDPTKRFANGAELLAAFEPSDPSLVTASFGEIARWDAAPSIAVLPLVNLSADPENEYFSDGIAAEVLSALTRVHGLRVAASTSSFAFKGQSVDLRTVGEKLRVRHVLEGNVRRAGSRVRIAVQLVSAADGLTLWTERYDRELADIFAVQDEIAQSIAEALARTLVGGERHAALIVGEPRQRGAVNPDAFELYLRGRHLMEQRNDGMLEALRCFQQAIQLAPDFSACHAGIAYSLVAFGIYYELRPHDAFPQARDAADRALAIDPTDALALVMRAHTALWYEWDYRRAEEMARRALELAPGLYLAHHCLGLVLAAQGQFEEAIDAMQRARSLDPLSEYATAELAWVLILAGRWQQAIRELEPAVARHPLATELRRPLAFCLFYAGRLEEARTALQRVLELNVGDRWGCTNLVQVLAALGETTEAQRLASEIEQRAPHEPIPPLGIAIMHHWLGDDERALQWLELSVEARDYWLVMMRFDPSMKRLRQDPRFASLLQRVRAGTSP